MLPNRTFKRGSANVTLGLVDGKLKGGRMTVFAPHAPDQRVDVASVSGHVVSVLLPTEQVAYVGFHRDPGDGPPRVPERSTLRVRISGFGQFNVKVPADAVTHPLGFYAVPSDPDSPYSELFFYAHGVNVKENTEPL